MQLLPPLTQDREAGSREQSGAAHLPYLRHVDDNTIELSDGVLAQTIRLDGLLFETADAAEINYRAKLRDATLQAISSSRFAIYHHILRRRAEVALEPNYQDRFSLELDERWRAKLKSRQMYVNDLFLTVIRRPSGGNAGILDGLRGRLAKGLARDEAARMADRLALNAASQALLSALSGYRPKMLAVRETETGLRSELVEFLSYLYNSEMRPLALPHGPLNEYMPFRRVSFGQDALELSATAGRPRKFGAIISIKDYPSETFPGMFDALARMPFELTVSQSFGFVERTQALGRMNLALRRMRSSEDEAVTLRHELSRAKDEVAAGKAGFGEHHLTIALFADDPSALNEQVGEVTAILADLAIIGIREDIALEPAFWAQFPGNFRYIGRPAIISTRNFASFASLHNFPVGRARGNHWGDAVTLLETTAAGPYFFNFHQNDLGNFTIIGPSGSGKTVVLNFLLAQARKFRPKIVFFDKDRGAELFIRAIGGQYDRLQPGRPSGLNPLQMENDASNRQFLLEWIALLAGGLDESETEIVRSAIEANFEEPPPQRRLRNLVELFRGYSRPHARDLYARMRRWWGTGDRAWLFDNEEDCTDLKADTVGFDVTTVLDEPGIRTPALFYFFHRVEQRLDGSPVIIVVDEGWKALDDDVFARRIKDWEKTVRKRNGIVGFATQSAQDALESRISSAIIEQAATQIFMINPKARAEDYVDGFGLSDHEFELVRTLPDSSHCFLIKHGNDSVVARLNLSGETSLLTVLSGREETVRRFDALVEQTGPDPEAWMDPLLERSGQ